MKSLHKSYLLSVIGYYLISHYQWLVAVISLYATAPRIKIIDSLPRADKFDKFAVVAKMFWTAGLVLVALVFGQVRETS